MWRSAPVRSSSSCSERLRPTESGLKIRGDKTVDLSGSTGRREGTAPSTLTAGTSLTATQYSPPTGKSRSSGWPEFSRAEAEPVAAAGLRDRVLAGSEGQWHLGAVRQLHDEEFAGG